MERERVEHPSWYIREGIECMVIVRNFCFTIGNSIKYLWRAGSKPEEGMTMEEKSKEDIRKAKYYLERWLEYPTDATCKLDISHYDMCAEFAKIKPSGNVAQCLHDLVELGTFPYISRSDMSKLIRGCIDMLNKEING